jgi:polyisoprenoid-binding protein YceI
MMISNVKGSFSKLSGVLNEDPVDHRHSSVEASVDVSTLSTGDAQRDGHLKSGDFLSIEEYPTITFTSTAVRPTGGTSFELDGDLTIKDVTRPSPRSRGA